MTQRNPGNVAGRRGLHGERARPQGPRSALCAAVICSFVALWCAGGGTAACAGTPILRGPEGPRFPQKELLRCSEAGRLPPHCQSGPHDRRFPSLPSVKDAVARGAYEEPGQMGEEAAAAKRLFDEERWAEASPMLARVAYGETKDDAGNRQLAEYRLAIALYKQGDLTGAADLFVAIAREPSHLKFDETLFWVFKLLTGGCVTSYLLETIVRYTPAETSARRDWIRPQPGIPEAALFVSSRARFEDGRRLESIVGFRDLVDDPEWGPLARECIALATR